MGLSHHRETGGKTLRTSIPRKARKRKDGLGKEGAFTDENKLQLLLSISRLGAPQDRRGARQAAFVSMDFVPSVTFRGEGGKICRQETICSETF